MRVTEGMGWSSTRVHCAPPWAQRCTKCFSLERAAPALPTLSLGMSREVKRGDPLTLVSLLVAAAAFSA